MLPLETNQEPHAEINIEGIQCDAPGCDFVDMSIQVSQYEEYINKPCPKCGANLLTQKDHDTIMALIESVRISNTFTEEELRVIQESMTPEEIDRSLDMINDAGLKMVERYEDGKEFWSTDKRLKEC